MISEKFEKLKSAGVALVLSLKFFKIRSYYSIYLKLGTLQKQI